jgi:vesicle-fusing ATPase
VGTVGFNRQQREGLQVALGDAVRLAPFRPSGDKYFLSDLLVTVDLALQGTKPVNMEHGAIVQAWKESFMGHFFTIGQVLWLMVDKLRVKCEIKELACMDMAAIMSGKASSPGSSQMGQVIKQTSLAFVSDRKSLLRVQGGGESALGGGGGQTTLLNPDFNFEKMGIGGLDKEFGSIFRRAFASRIFPAREIAKYGIKHVRGMLLFGPPGTGKTLMARQIGKMLNSTEPKIVSGPEILNKFVGESEAAVRKLFEEAEAEYSERGDDSNLHIIIFDEIDAVCKARGSRNNGTGVGDTVVNQLLAKLDGVKQLNNILVIGMTNRKDMIDEALLRPGRLEIHMEIGLPDERGRVQILGIHTQKMRENNKLGKDVSMEVLGSKTKNFSGAEIEGLVKSATAYALNEVVNADDVGKNLTKVQTPLVNMIHFECALKEVIPAFGLDQGEFDNLRGNITPFSKEFQKVMATLKQFVSQVQHSDKTPLLTVLLSGDIGCGKTSVALETALSADFPFVKLINPASLVAYQENTRCEKIAKVFEDAHRSPLSVVVVDDIERLIDYVAIGPRFSNSILQTLAVYLRMPPPKGRKLMVICTTSKKRVLETMEITDCCNATLEIPNVMSGTEAVRVLQAPGQNYERADLKTIMDGFQTEIPVKKLLMVSEMAKQGNPEVDLGTRFLEAMQSWHS